MLRPLSYTKGRTSFTVFFIDKDFFQISQQWRNVLFNSLPDNIQIDIIIAMDQAIAHAHNGIPWNTRIILSEFYRNAGGSLSNDL